MNFNTKCKHCKKKKGLHQAHTLNCPMGKRSRIGYITYDKTKTFEPKTEDHFLKVRTI